MPRLRSLLLPIRYSLRLLRAEDVRLRHYDAAVFVLRTRSLRPHAHRLPTASRRDRRRNMKEELERASIEAASVLAKAARVFFLESVAQGFSEAQALTLTQSWLGALCGTPKAGA